MTYRGWLLAFAIVAAIGRPVEARCDEALAKIKTVVVIYAENRSFDHLFGFFPGANGIDNATDEQRTQLDHDGKPLQHLVIFGGDGRPDPRFPRLPNAPFRIDAPPVNGRADAILLNPTHAFYHNQEQINGGRNNMFAAMSSVGGWTMGYFGNAELRLMQWAKDYTLADNFFMGAFGGSYLNHQWLICACAPRDPGAPESARARLDDRDKLLKRENSPASVMQGPVLLFDGRISPDGHTVNTSQPAYQPSGIPPASADKLDFANEKLHPVPPLHE